MRIASIVIGAVLLLAGVGHLAAQSTTVELPSGMTIVRCANAADTLWLDVRGRRRVDAYCVENGEGVLVTPTPRVTATSTVTPTTMPTETPLPTPAADASGLLGTCSNIPLWMAGEISIIGCLNPTDIPYPTIDIIAHHMPDLWLLGELEIMLQYDGVASISCYDGAALLNVEVSGDYQTSGTIDYTYIRLYGDAQETPFVGPHNYLVQCRFAVDGTLPTADFRARATVWDYTEINP